MLKKEKNISQEESNKIIDYVLAKDCNEVGIFISLLSNKYINLYQISKENFIQSLSNSIDKLNEEE